MGLEEQIAAGATALRRESVAFTLPFVAAQISGSVSVGRSFVLTAVQASTRCRVRLYGDQISRDNVTEKARPFASQSLQTGVSLIADIDLNTEQLFNLTPPIFGFNLDNPISTNIYYTIDTGSATPLSATDRITLTRFLIEDPAVVNSPGVVTRQVLTINSASIASGSSVTGSITSPRTYLLYKIRPNAVPLRLRLYTSASYRDLPSEVSRSFGTEPASGSGLITDIFMEDLMELPMTPVLVGRNDNDLANPNISADAETYYRLTNGSATSPVSASLFTFSLED